MKLLYEKMPEIEKWILDKVYKLSKDIVRYTEKFELNNIYRDVYEFCNSDLSSFYFDIEKILYCADPNSIERKRCRTIMDIIFNSVCT